MKIEKIKPIPKYIVKRIEQMDKKGHPQNGTNRYYSYLTKNDGELVKVTCCVKTRYNKICIKQCIIHGLDSKVCFVKDTDYTIIAGYRTGWYYEGHTKYPKWYEDGKWDWALDKYFNIYSPIVNKEFVGKFKEFKYSAYKEYPYVDILQYLRLYRQYPECEYMVKLGLAKYTDSKQILNKLHKDNRFKKFICKSSKQLAEKTYYIKAILDAYKHNLDLDQIQRLIEKRLLFNKYDHHKEISELFNGKLESFINYIDQQNTNFHSYYDYIHACKELGIDLSQQKNLIPHDFKKWHDIRIDEYHTLQAERDRQLKKELYERFAEISIKYSTLEKIGRNAFVCIIATSPQDLIKEGDALHHCVGRMNYDQKFAREESLIFFIRNKEEIEKPLVTIEYSPSKKKVLQCYGDHDSKPNEDIEKFVYKTWLPYANKQLKKIAA